MIDSVLRAGLFAGVPVQVGFVGAAAAAAFVAAPGEAALIAAASPRRRADFARGRLAARAALAHAGVAGVAIVADADRVPCWPAGFVGSIAHTAEVAVAVVARAAEVTALGVDVEVATALAPDLWAQVLTAAERAAVLALPEADRGWAALRYFCAKEAAYKAGFPSRRRIIEFSAMAVEFAGEAFVARWEGSAGPPLVGRCLRTADLQFAAAWQVAAPPTASR